VQMQRGVERHMFPARASDRDANVHEPRPVILPWGAEPGAANLI
jgi:hypothetical protein